MFARIRDLFHVPEEGRISDRTMLARLVLSITVILLCLAAMTSSAYALYKYDVTSGVNVVKVSVPQTEPKGFTTVFQHTDSYLYRVGNRNEIRLGKLFSTVEGVEADSSKVSLAMEVASPLDAGAVTYQLHGNADNWKNGTVKFSGSGVVKLTVKTDDNSVAPYTLNLEVIDAKNVTTAESATANNVVLLNDVNNASGFTVSGGYAFYGNGFELHYTGDGRQSNKTVSNFGTAYVTVNGGTLDNTRVICSQFAQSTGSVPGDVVQADGAYLYMMPAVTARGNAVIENCYIFGARDNIYSDSGNITIRNVVCECAATANIQLWSSDDYTVTLDNVTTIQYKYNNDTVYGLGIVNGHNESASNANIIINNALNQYNWVKSNDASKLSSNVAKVAIQQAAQQTAFQHTYEGNQYVNLGIAYLNDKDHAITDLRANASEYIYSSLTMLTFEGGVYSVRAGKGEVLLENYTYDTLENGLYVPSMRLKSDLGGQLIPYDANSADFCYIDNGMIKVQFANGESKVLNLIALMNISKYTGQDLHLSILCVDEDGNTVPLTDGKLTLTEQKSYTVTYNLTDTYIFDSEGTLTSANKEYKTTLRIIASVKDVLIPNAEFEFNQSTMRFYASATGATGKYHYLPILNGLKIYDYDQSGNRYLRFDGDSANQVAQIVSIVSTPNGDLTSYVSEFTLLDGGKITISHSFCGDQAPGEKGSTIKKGSDNKIYVCTDNKTNGNGMYWKVFGYQFVGNNGTEIVVPSSAFDPVTPIKLTTEPSSYVNEASSANISGGHGTLRAADIVMEFDEEGNPTNGIVFVGTKDPQYYRVNVTMSGQKYAYYYGRRVEKTNVTMSSFSPVILKTVTFDANSGRCAQQVAYTTSNATNVTLPTPTRGGFEFAGWYTAAIGGTKRGGAGESYTPTSNETLYAHWFIASVVTLNANGGTCATTSISNAGGNEIYLPTPSYGDRAFLGWFTESIGGVRIGGSGDYYVPSGSITLYAQWGEPVIVTYNANGGSVTPASEAYTSAKLTLPSPALSGYWCTGWYDAAEDGNLIGKPGASYEPTASITLYAQWALVYTVTYDANGGSVSTPSTSSGTDGTVLLPTPTRTGYTFSGWYTATSGGTKIGNGDASYTPTANVTVFAQWTVNSYKVTITTSNSSTTVTVNGTTVSSGGSVAYNSVVKVELSYTQTDSLTFTIMQGSADVTRYTDEACTSSTTSSDAYTYYFKMPAGDVTINSSSKASSCFVEGTLITMADGTKKPIEEIQIGDMILTWNFYEGKVEAQPVSMYWDHDTFSFEIVNLSFADGSVIRIINNHGLFDSTLNRFVFIDAFNYSDYIGHEFVAVDISGEYYNVVLSDAWLTTEEIGCYSLRSAYNDNAIAEGFITLTTEDFEGITTCFEVGDNMTYDREKLQELIDTYSLYTYDEWSDYMSEDIFNMFNCKYYKIYVGLGILKEEDFYNLLAGLYENLAQQKS